MSWSQGIAGRAALLAAVALTALPLAGRAEEGGSGHYLPGSIASFIDGVPPDETFLIRFNGVDYIGSAAINRPLPFAGLAALHPKANVGGGGVTVLWRPPLDLGPRWSYAMSATIPLISANVSANLGVTLPNGLAGTVDRSSSTVGLGDIVLMPLMLNYNVNPDFNINGRVGFYAPTGSYQDGRLANTGKNYWTTEPMLGFMYFGKKNGVEVSVFAGSDFNTENPATHYKSGTQFHVDGTLAQHFPALGGLAGFGVNAYDYTQVSADSGNGANLGPFEGQTAGLGPVVSYAGKVAGQNTVWECKWLHEVETHNRLSGDIFWLKIVDKF
jgi:hypothetical protein